MAKALSTEPSRIRQRQTLRETVRERPTWMSIFAPIKAAADAGNRREAIRLLDEYIKARKSEAA